MERKIFMSWFVLLLFIPTVQSFQNSHSIISNGKRFQVLNDTNVELMALHTAKSSGWVDVSLISKKYTGNIDIAFGFNSSKAKPTKARLYAPHNVSWNTHHSKFFLNVSSFSNTVLPCDFGNEYNTYKKLVHYHYWNSSTDNQTNTTTKRQEETSAVVCFDSYSQNGGNYTAYWHTKYEKQINWKDISGIWTAVNLSNTIVEDKTGFNRWYYAKNVPVVAGKKYRMQFYLDIKFTGLKPNMGEYAIAMKPSSESIFEAITKDHFYYLDPWWNSSYSYRRNITNSSTSLIVPVAGNDSGFSDIDGNGVKEIIYGQPQYLYYNDENDTAIANDTTEFYMAQTKPIRRIKGAPADSSLKLFLSFDGSDTEAMDYSGNGNNGTLYNSPTQGISSPVGYAYEFSGTSYAVVPHSGEFQTGSLSAGFSLLVIFKTSSTNATITILDKRGSTQYLNPILESGKIKFQTKDAQGDYCQPITSGTYNDGKWHTVVMVIYNPSTCDTSNWKIYVDGVDDTGSIAAQSGTFDNFDSTGNIGISARADGSQNYPINISEIRWYNRSLSATEISELYNAYGGTYLGAEETETSFSITLNSPPNETSTQDKTPDFNFTVSGTEDNYACELFIDNVSYSSDEKDSEDSYSINGSCLDSYPCENSIDEDWSSMAIADNGAVYVYENFSIPSLSNYIVNWTYKYYSGGTDPEPNVTIYCYNNSDWQLFVNFHIPDYTGGTGGSYTFSNTIPESCLNDPLQIKSRFYRDSGANQYLHYHEGKVVLRIENNIPTIITANSSLSDGTYNWYINCTAGNVTNQSEIREITIDTTPPTTTASAVDDMNNSYAFNTWTNSSYVNVTLSCSDSGAGCDVTQYCLDTVNNCTPNLTYTGVIQISTEGISYIRYRSNDTAGNLETTKNQTIKINAPPTAIVSITPLYPTPDDDLQCNVYSINDQDGHNVSITGYDWHDGTSWLGINSSTLTSSYLFDGGVYKCSATLFDGYESITIESDTVTVGYGCIAYSSHKFETISTVDYLLLNFSSISLVDTNLTNVFTPNTVVGLYDNCSLLLNASTKSNVVVYLGGDLVKYNYTSTNMTPDSTIEVHEDDLNQTNTLYRINLKNERGGTWDISQNNINSTTLSFTCGKYGKSEIDILNINKTSIRVPIKKTPDRLIMHLTYTDGNKYFRSFIPSSSTENISMYLIDVSTDTAVFMTFTLQDLTGFYTNSTIRFLTYVNEKLSEVTSDVFDVSNVVQCYLIKDKRYYIRLEGEGTTKQIGWLYVSSSDTEKTITITDVEIESSSPYGDVSFAFVTDYNNSQVALHYVDLSNQTNSVTFKVYNSSGSELYSGTEESQDTSIIYTVPKVNETYILKAIIDHSVYGIINETRMIDFREPGRKVINLDLPDSILGLSNTNWYRLSSIFLIGFAGMLFGATVSGVGALMMVGLAYFFVYLGWISISSITMGIMLIVAVLHKLSERRRVN